MHVLFRVCRPLCIMFVQALAVGRTPPVRQAYHVQRPCRMLCYIHGAFVVWWQASPSLASLFYASALLQKVVVYAGLGVADDPVQAYVAPF